MIKQQEPKNNVITVQKVEESIYKSLLAKGITKDSIGH